MIYLKNTANLKNVYTKMAVSHLDFHIPCEKLWKFAILWWPNNAKFSADYKNIQAYFAGL